LGFGLEGVDGGTTWMLIGGESSRPLLFLGCKMSLVCSRRINQVVCAKLRHHTKNGSTDIGAAMIEGTQAITSFSYIKVL
jgi:hypothetical protein